MKKGRDIGLEAWILAGTLLLATGLRLAGVGWEIPVDNYTGYYHPDEPKVIRAVAEFPSHIWRNHDLRYPTLYPYILALITYLIRGLIQECLCCLQRMTPGWDTTYWPAWAWL